MTKASEFAASYIEDLLTFFGLNTKVETSENEGVIEVAVPSTRLNGFLIGLHGQNLRSIQYLLNMAIRSAGYVDVVAVVDIAGYKRQRNERLARQAEQLAAGVIESGQPHVLNPMSPAERRIIHKTVSEIDGVESSSDGEGRDRHVVIRKSTSAS